MEVKEDMERSDHRELRFTLNWRITRELNPILVPEFRRANYLGLRRQQEEVNWGALGLYEGQDAELEINAQKSVVEVIYINSVRMIVEGQRQHIPCQTCRTETSDLMCMTLYLYA